MIDLHFHSTYSDGDCTPAQLAALGREQGLSAMILTDHDTTDGVAPFLAPLMWADLNGDLAVDAQDLLLLAQYLGGMGA